MLNSVLTQLSQTPFQVSCSLNGQKVNLSNKNPISWYMCGPTVYDSSHLGHARTYLSFDIIRRVLSLFNRPTQVLMGITDVDDKILNRASEKGIPPLDLARTYENEFFQDMDSFGILRPDKVSRVSEHIPEIISFIQQLLNNNAAYMLEDGIYFNTQFSENDFQYGKMAPVNKSVQSRLVDSSTIKKNDKDFCLWKRCKDSETFFWDADFDVVSDIESLKNTINLTGRPGWHIECSAMCKTHFGDSLNFHTGGIDLKFPHHTNEIAQCEALFQKSWCDSFIHTGHLYIEGQKMSKSLKNFTTIQSFLQLNHPDSFRIACLTTPYHQSMYYNPKVIQEANSVVKSLNGIFSNMMADVENVSDNSSFRSTQIDHDLNFIFTRCFTDICHDLLDDFSTKPVFGHLKKAFTDYSTIVSGSISDVSNTSNLGNFASSFEKTLSSSNKSQINRSSANLIYSFLIDSAYLLNHGLGLQTTFLQKHPSSQPIFTEFHNVSPKSSQNLNILREFITFFSKQHQDFQSDSSIALITQVEQLYTFSRETALEDPSTKKNQKSLQLLDFYRDHVFSPVGYRYNVETKRFDRVVG